VRIDSSDVEVRNRRYAVAKLPKSHTDAEFPSDWRSISDACRSKTHVALLSGRPELSTTIRGALENLTT
jgi:hypothetical protein